MNKTAEYWLKLMELIPWVIAALTAIGANLAAYSVSETANLWTAGEIGVISPLLSGYVLFFFIMVSILYRQRNIFFRPRTRYMLENEAEKRKHLILFLSNLPKELEKSKGIPMGLQLTNNIYEDLKRIEESKAKNPPVRWQWEMPIRGIIHHLGNTGEIGVLKSVTLICSKESLQQVHLFFNVCKRYSELSTVIFHILAQQNDQTKLIDYHAQENINSLQGYDFEAFDKLSHAIWILFREFKGKVFILVTPQAFMQPPHGRSEIIFIKVVVYAVSGAEARTVFKKQTAVCANEVLGAWSFIE